MIEIGIDSFATNFTALGSKINSSESLRLLLQRIQFADEKGLDVFGIGEHHRKEFLDSAPSVILAAAAGTTQRIKLTSAVSVIGADDPVRLFQNYATLDLITQGRAEIVVGRGSFVDAYPLFGLNLEDYDALFAEKLDLLLQIRDNETVNWNGRFRPALKDQAIYPRPFQEKLPIWLGVGGTTQSFVRAGRLGLPLMVAVIGGETHRFRPLVDLYRESGLEAGHKLEDLKVGLHSTGFVGATTPASTKIFLPGYTKAMNNIGKERGWGPLTQEHFERETSPLGAIVLGGPEEVAEKIIRHAKALGGISRFTFQMDVANLEHEYLMEAIELIGDKVIPIIREMEKV